MLSYFALGVLSCFALFVCLFDLACFFLSSFSSLIKLNTCIYTPLVLCCRATCTQHFLAPFTIIAAVVCVLVLHACSVCGCDNHCSGDAHWEEKDSQVRVLLNDRPFLPCSRIYILCTLIYIICKRLMYSHTCF